METESYALDATLKKINRTSKENAKKWFQRPGSIK